MYELQYDCSIHHIAEKRYHTFAEEFQKYFFRLFFGTLQLVVFIPTGSLEPKSWPRGDLDHTVRISSSENAVQFIVI